MRVIVFAAIVCGATATAPEWPPATPPSLNRHTDFSGTGSFSFGGSAATTAAVYQSDSTKQLRIDAGDLTGSGQEHSFFTKNGEFTLFLTVNSTGSNVICVAGGPGETTALNYDQQLQAYDTRLLNFLGSMTFSGDVLNGSPELLAFGGNICDGTRGCGGSVVLVENNEASLLRGEWRLTDAGLSVLTLDSVVAGAPNSTVFELPAQCTSSSTVNAAAAAEATELSTSSPPLALATATFQSTGLYFASAAQDPDIAMWDQDASTKQLLIAVGDLSDEHGDWQINYYNESGSYLILLENGIPKCFTNPDMSYSAYYADTAASLQRVATASIAEYPKFGDLELYAGVSNQRSVVYYLDTDGIPRIYDDFDTPNGLARLVMTTTTTTAPSAEDFDIQALISYPDLNCTTNKTVFVPRVV